jgi:hypothetical protein
MILHPLPGARRQRFAHLLPKVSRAPQQFLTNRGHSRLGHFHSHASTLLAQFRKSRSLAFQSQNAFQAEFETLHTRSLVLPIAGACKRGFCQNAGQSSSPTD